MLKLYICKYFTYNHSYTLCLGLLFYVQPIGDIIRKHELKYHQYADDLQLFCHFPLDALSLSTAVLRIEQCIDELKDWMTANYLQVNDSKSDILPVIPRHTTDMTQGLRVRVGSDYVTAVRHVKNIGVYLDRHITLFITTAEPHNFQLPW